MGTVFCDNDFTRNAWPVTALLGFQDSSRVCGVLYTANEDVVVIAHRAVACSIHKAAPATTAATIKNLSVRME
jgi:hypothetical protein